MAFISEQGSQPPQENASLPQNPPAPAQTAPRTPWFVVDWSGIDRAAFNRMRINYFGVDYIYIQDCLRLRPDFETSEIRWLERRIKVQTYIGNARRRTTRNSFFPR